MVRNQAVALLHQLKCDLHRLPYTFRDLTSRKKSQLLSQPLSSVLNWVNRVSVALDRQSENSKLGVSDIRYWLNGKLLHRNQNITEKYIMPGCDVEYDSDCTLEFCERYPDEDLDGATWTCETNCCERLSLHGRFNLSDRFHCLPCLNEFLSNPKYFTINPT